MIVHDWKMKQKTNPTVNALWKKFVGAEGNKDRRVLGLGLTDNQGTIATLGLYVFLKIKPCLETNWRCGQVMCVLSKWKWFFFEGF